VSFNSPPGYEQGLGDLPVRLPGRRQLRDPELARSESITTPDGVAPRSPPGGDELVARMVCQRQAAEFVSQVQTLAKMKPGLAHQSGSPAGGAEVDESASQLEPRRRAAELFDGLGQQLYSLVRVANQCCCAEGDPDGAACPPAAGQAQLLRAEPASLCVVAEGTERRRCV
jgi:hypothetical protein